MLAGAEDRRRERLTRIAGLRSEPRDAEVTQEEVDACRAPLGTQAPHPVLLGPPTDDDVRVKIPERIARQRAIGERLGGIALARSTERCDRDETLQQQWLLDHEETPRDPFCGLSQETVDGYLTVTHAVLGTFPVTLAEARATAWLAAAEEDRKLARFAQKVPGMPYDRHGWRMRELQHTISRENLAAFLVYAQTRAEDDEHAAAVARLWTQPGFRDMVAAFRNQQAGSD